MDEQGQDGQRVPPSDEMAEQSVLGSMMLSKTALWEVIEVLQPGDFYHPKHELVFRAAVAVAMRNEPVDLVSVSDELARTGETVRAGGVGYAAELTSVPPTASNAAYYAGIVKSKAVKRRMIAAGTRIVEMGFSHVGDPLEQAEAARAELDAVATNAATEVETIGSTFASVVVGLEENPQVVETPWPEINDLITGLRPGTLDVIGARPGEGKTIVGLQLAEELAQKGSVAFSSLEMSRAELVERMIAGRARVHMGSIARHSLTDEEWRRVAEVRAEIERMPLYIDDRSGVTVMQIKAFARSVKRRGHLSGVVVDYVQLIQGAGRKDTSRNEVVGEITRQLKIMARELEVPVIALAQLNRDVITKGKLRPPTLSDLRESGSIEQDADLVILLQRLLEKDDQPGDRIDMHVAKHRKGRTGRRTLFWEGQYARVSSMGGRYVGFPLPVQD